MLKTDIIVVIQVLVFLVGLIVIPAFTVISVNNKEVKANSGQMRFIGCQFAFVGICFIVGSLVSNPHDLVSVNRGGLTLYVAVVICGLYQAIIIEEINPAALEGAERTALRRRQLL